MTPMTYDPHRICPGCEERGGLDYTRISAGASAKRTHTENGETFVEHYGVLRDYRCRHCDTEFTLTNWSDS